MARKLSPLNAFVLFLSYLLWIVSITAGVGAALMARSPIMKLYILLLVRSNPWTIGVVDKAVIIVLFLGWIILAIFCESYYRQGAAKGQLLRRFGLATIPSVILIGLGYILGFTF